jgi:hypothetical protein
MITTKSLSSHSYALHVILLTTLVENYGDIVIANVQLFVVAAGVCFFGRHEGSNMENHLKCQLYCKFSSQLRMIDLKPE